MVIVANTDDPMMNDRSNPLAPDARARLRLLVHGSAVAVIGLLSGFGLVFSILGTVSVWPVTIPTTLPIPGSEHGWQVAHVAGVMNGLLMMAVGLALPPVRASARVRAWIVWSMIYTGWGNTIFFHCANLSSNRGLSAGVTRFGPADPAGTIGYVIGGSTIPFTIAALVLLGLSAFRLLRQR